MKTKIFTEFCKYEYFCEKGGNVAVWWGVSDLLIMSVICLCPTLSVHKKSSPKLGFC